MLNLMNKQKCNYDNFNQVLLSGTNYAECYNAQVDFNVIQIIYYETILDVEQTCQCEIN